MDESKRLVEQLQELARNLWWSWQPEMWHVFRDIDPKLWRQVNHNPIAFLDRTGSDKIVESLKERALASRIQNAHRKLQEYQATLGPAAREVGPLRAAPVAYFCAEFGLHESFPIYSGGLGVLAGDHMKASSDLGIPIIGIGLFYPLGYFQQGIDAQGWQKEYYGRTDIDTLPIEKITDADGEPVEIEVEADKATIKAHIWRAPVGRNELWLLDSDVPGNNEEDRQLTGQLYGGDQRRRIRQELLLGVGGVRALRKLGVEPGVYHLNEGHSAFATLELASYYMQHYGMYFDEARDEVRRKTVFTTHTPVPAGHDRFPIELFESMVGWIRPRLNLDHYHFHGLGRVNRENPKEPFCMTVLAMKMADHVNGVSNLHGHVSRRMWKGLWPKRELADVPIGHITNGVHVSSFLASEMRAVYDRHLPLGWERQLDDPEMWQGLGEVEPGELWEVHQVLKAKLIDFIHRRVDEQEAPRGEGDGQIRAGSGFDPEVLTIGFARRFATYKRATLVMRERERFKQLVTDAERPLQIVFAGKAHPADDYGKKFIQEIVEITTDPAFKGRVVFLADYDLNVARHMVQGVDVWLNNPRRPEEACGTSGQKVVLNGGLNCSILDGWWAEAYDGRNGFAIGHGAEFADPERQDENDARELYKVLEQEVIPLYYDTDDQGLRRRWIAQMKWAMTSLGWRFNAARMLRDYLREAYLPAVGATTKYMPR